MHIEPADLIDTRLRVATWNLEWLNRRDGTGPVKRVEADYARLRRYADKLDADESIGTIMPSRLPGRLL